jgi:hypothetical protein
MEQVGKAGNRLFHLFSAVIIGQSSSITNMMGQNLCPFRLRRRFENLVLYSRMFRT